MKGSQVTTESIKRIIFDFTLDGFSRMMDFTHDITFDFTHDGHHVARCPKTTFLHTIEAEFRHLESAR